MVISSIFTDCNSKVVFLWKQKKAFREPVYFIIGEW